METNSNVQTEQLPPQGGPHGVRRLTRRVDHRMLGGVAAGLADYFGVDPVWFRLAFVVSAFLGGAGIIAYLAMWVLVPPVHGPSEHSVPLGPRMERIARRIDRTPAWVGVALLVVGMLLVVDRVVRWRPGVFWGLALVGLGVLLFRRAGERPRPVPPPEVADLAEPAEPAGGLALPSERESLLPAPPEPPGLGEPGSVSVAAVARRAPRERSPLGWMTTGAILLALGVAALLDQAGVVHVSLVQYLALPLALMGAGLLVGAFWGRARWLILPALLLLPFVLVASLIRVPLSGGAGNRTVTPVTAADIRPVYRLGAGQLLLDLSQTSFESQPVFLRATDVAGRILVTVPPGAGLDVRGRVGAGQVDLFGQTFGGLNVDVRRTFGGDAGSAVIHLDLETSLGVVEVSS